MRGSSRQFSNNELASSFAVYRSMQDSSFFVQGMVGEGFVLEELGLLGVYDITAQRCAKQ